MNVIDQSVYLRVIGKTDVNYFTVYSEWAFPSFSTRRENHVEVLQDLVETDVDVCVHAANSNCATHPSKPTRRCDSKLPRLALRNRRRCCFFWLQLQCSSGDGANQCTQCRCL